MKLSVIIPSRFGIPQSLKTSLSNQTYKSDEVIEVIGSALTVQRNEGIKKATGDIILFLDDDITIKHHLFLFHFINTFYRYPNAVAVTGNVKVSMYKTNLLFAFLYEIYARIFRLLYRGKGRYFLSGFSENYHPEINTIIRGEMLYGCCMAFRKEIFNEFHFDESIENYMYGEDDFFAYPLSRKYDVYYNPFAICYDNRPYPKGKQAQKVRSTFINLIKRHKKRNPTFRMKIAFVWSMIGFTIFKIMEAIVMRDMSIIKGMLLCFRKQPEVNLDEIRKSISIKILQY